MVTLHTSGKKTDNIIFTYTTILHTPHHIHAHTTKTILCGDQIFTKQMLFLKHSVKSF